MGDRADFDGWVSEGWVCNGGRSLPVLECAESSNMGCVTKKVLCLEGGSVYGLQVDSSVSLYFPRRSVSANMVGN